MTENGRSILSKTLTPMERRALGLIMREARERAGLTQAQFGKKVGAAISTVSKWESGDLVLPIAKFPEVGKTLGVDLYSAIGRAAEMPNAQPVKESRLLTRMQNCSPIQQALLMKTIELLEQGKLDDTACVDLLASWKHLFA